MIDLETLMTPKEISEKYRIALSTVYSLGHRGILPARRINKSMRFRASEVEKAIQKMTDEAYGNAA